MPGAQKKRKTWEEKLNDAKDLPKVVQLRGKAKQRWHANTLAIASPREIFSFIRQVPEGSVATIADLQSAGAKKHAAELGCPLTTGSLFGLLLTHRKSSKQRVQAPARPTGES